jgi:hypothetical protein
MPIIVAKYPPMVGEKMRPIHHADEIRVKVKFILSFLVDEAIHARALLSLYHPEVSPW